MSRMSLIVTLALAIAVAPSDLSGQDGTPVKTAELVPVDQTVADHNPLSTSLRIGNPGLDEPNDFSELFRLPGPDGRLIRAQGGLYAIFDQSVYTTDKEGDVRAGISAGTLFHIGRPTATTPTRPMHSAAPHRLLVDHRLKYRMPPATVGEAREAAADRRRDWAFKPQDLTDPEEAWSADPDDDPTIATDPAYRAVRLRSILLSAVEAYR